ncbi:MAG: class I SAM-dependent methyltransferase [Deltaproteobacteria bacterium]|nr:class I SAM-dependent methyltransferase [Deltaproteobacteria bacterium]
MGRMMSLFYDRYMRTSEAACLARWRAELLADVSGEVLELGVGTGASLPLYSSNLSRLVLNEPDRHMRRRLINRLAAQPLPLTPEVSDAAVESLPYATGSFDVVVSSLVLCSVGDLTAGLAEIHRVLRPAGRLVFLEHVAAAPGSRRRKWQQRVEPLWRRCSGNCHMTRETERAIVDAGFEIASVTRESIRKAMPLLRPSIRGVALKASRTAFSSL